MARSIGCRLARSAPCRARSMRPPASSVTMKLRASASSSDTGVKAGALNPVQSGTNGLTITSQDFGQNVTLNNSVGGRLNVPWIWSETKRLNFSGGIDGKQYKLMSYNTNEFTFIIDFNDPIFGNQQIVSKSSSSQPTRSDEILYAPLAFGVDFAGSDKSGSTLISLNVNYNFMGHARVSSSDFSSSQNPTNYPPTTTDVKYGKL